MKLYEIMPGLFFSGTMQKLGGKQKEELVRAHQIGYVVNLWQKGYDRELQLLMHDRYYIHLPMPEGSTYLPSAILQNRANMVAEIATSHVTLVQCYGGKNRSATVCAMVVMYREGISGDMAYQRVKSLRSGALNNPLYANFLRSLS